QVTSRHLALDEEPGETGQGQQDQGGDDQDDDRGGLQDGHLPQALADRARSWPTRGNVSIVIKAGLNPLNVRLFAMQCQGDADAPRDRLRRPWRAGKTRWAGHLGPAHPEIPHLCRVLGWFEPGSARWEPSARLQASPLARGMLTTRAEELPFTLIGSQPSPYITHSAGKRLPSSITPPRRRRRQAPDRLSTTAPSLAV